MDGSNLYYAIYERKDKDEMAKTAQRQLAYINEWNRINTKTVIFRLNKRNDADIIDRLAKEGKAPYIKRLIREDIKRSEQEK